ncbi:hypothetical protein ACFY04_04430 [Streptomyces sp. NPDC001549]|uniref:hypothetical protein n=1 Tax=Streptomyces sp. NPDC001549 TaxID=3364586 RepID=UPI00369DFF5A
MDGHGAAEPVRVPDGGRHPVAEPRQQADEPFAQQDPGADPAAGSGLTGLADRIAVLDGTRGSR